MRPAAIESVYSTDRLKSYELYMYVTHQRRKKEVTTDQPARPREHGNREHLQEEGEEVPVELPGEGG